MAACAEKNALWGKFLEATGSKLSDAPPARDFAMESEGYGYETAMGRACWSSRDPIGEDRGINLYGFCGNNGVNYIDAFGLWRIDRKTKHNWALATPEQGDTIRTLAKAAFLEPTEYLKWLKYPPKVKGLDDAVPTECKYYVPNTAVGALGDTTSSAWAKVRKVLTFGLGGTQKDYARRNLAEFRSKMESLGYRVEDEPNATLSVIQSILKRRDLAALMITSHGQDGMMTSSDGDYHVASDLRKDLDHKLALMYLNICYGAKDFYVSPMNPGWSGFISMYGSVYASTEYTYCDVGDGKLTQFSSPNLPSGDTSFTPFVSK